MTNPFLACPPSKPIADAIIPVTQGLKVVLFEGPVMPQVEAGGSTLYVKKHPNDNNDPLIVGTLRTGNVNVVRDPAILYASFQVSLTAKQTEGLERGTYYYTVVYKDILGDTTSKVTDGHFEVKTDASSRAEKEAIRE